MVNGVSDDYNSPSVFLDAPTSGHTVTAWFIDANASISALSVFLEASDDDRGVADADARWYELLEEAFDSDQLTAKSGMAHVTGKSVKRVRVRITHTGAATGDLIYARYIQGTEK